MDRTSELVASRDGWVGFLWSLLSLGVDVAAGLSLSLSLIELGARTASLDAQRYRLNSAAFPRDAIDGGRAGRRGIGII